MDEKEISQIESKEKRIKIYLLIYNFFQTLGWTVLLLKIVQYYTFLNSDISLYEHVKWTLIIIQNAAVLEVVHCSLKFVPSNPTITFQQISSRVMIVCGILVPAVSPRESSGLLYMLLTWCITEIIRYSNYALNLVNKVPYILTWLRYSTFIILYPAGVVCEVLCLITAVLEIRTTRAWCLDFPNKWNIIFYYDYYITFYISLYIPLFPQMFYHMLQQRAKILRSYQKKVD